MKIAVVAIALNEEQFVDRWVKSALDADYIILGDTGSTDTTVERFESWNNYCNPCSVNHQPEFISHSLTVRPWRFDIARNALHALIPSDVNFVINLDMDEVLVEGWRDKLEAVPSGVNRPRYVYTWSWNLDGSPGLQYQGDKICTRDGFYWKHPVHEVLKPYIDEVQGDIQLEIHHYPDASKSRGQYLPLLELAVREDPYDDRNMYYYARELFFAGRNEEAVVCFRKHIEMSNWAPEKAQSYRYIAKCTTDLWGKVGHLMQAHVVSPDRREALVDIAMVGYQLEEWDLTFAHAKKALNITEKPLDYICEPFAWGAIPYDMAAIAAYRLGRFQEAFEYGSNALELEPWDERLQENFRFYEEAV